jgi:carbamoyl-phosphate synthase small subunit
MKAIIMLEDGRSFFGEADGSKVERIGEVIMNTAVVGYQEMMTDPANAGKILVLTYPLIGNYGCATKFNESDKVWLAGLIIKEKTRISSNWQSTMSFDDFVKKNNLFSLSGIDTRTLAVHLRQKGSMLGIISTSCFQEKELLSRIAEFRKNKTNGILAATSTKSIKKLGKTGKKNIAVLDLGITNSLIKQLERLGASLTLFPYNTKAKDILKLKPKGLVISGGPEEISDLGVIAENVKELIGKLPILGIAAGNLVLGIALGAKISKLKTGHRGVNYPMRNPASFKGEITVQNHGFAIDAFTLLKTKNVSISGFNLNDRTVEEIESKKLKLIGVQYNPVSLGFNEPNSVLKRFINLLKRS